MPSSPRIVVPYAAGLVLAATLGSCLSSNPPVSRRYFAPLPPDPAPNQLPDAMRDTGLDLLRVDVLPYIDTRMIWRQSDVEIQYDEENVWAAQPDLLIHDALVRRLFGASGYRPSFSGPRTELQVGLVRFEAIRGEPTAFEVVLVAGCSYEDGHFRRERFVGRVELADSSPESIARAAGAAIAEATDRLVAWIGESD